MFLGLENFRPVLGIFSHHEDAVGLRCYLENAVASVERRGDGFFQQHVLAGFKALDGDCFVQIVGQQDVHGVEVTIRQRLTERGERPPSGFFGIGLRLGRVDVDQGGEVHAGDVPFDAVKMKAGDCPAAYEREFELVRHGMVLRSIE